MWYAVTAITFAGIQYRRVFQIILARGHPHSVAQALDSLNANAGIRYCRSDT